MKAFKTFLENVLAEYYNGADKYCNQIKVIKNA